MTEQQIQLVQESWAKIAPSSDQVAVLFYDRLFEIATHFKPLFKNDITEQGRKLMRMISMAIHALPNLEQVLPAVQQSGVRHTEYGVQPQDYEVVGAALLWTLEQGLGDDYTAELQEAWTLTYATLADVMKEAAAATVA